MNNKTITKQKAPFRGLGYYEHNKLKNHHQEHSETEVIQFVEYPSSNNRNGFVYAHLLLHQV
jgi:hypothetical protein